MGGRSRKLVAAVAAATLGVAGYALAADVTLTLGPSGPQPPLATVDYGDTVSFVNADSVTHGVTSPRDDLRADTVAPGATYTSVVTARAGSYQLRQTGGKTFTATVVVVAGGTVSLTARPAAVPYGRTVAVSGAAAKPVLLERRDPGATEWQPAAELVPDSDGRYATTLRLKAGTKLRASIDGGQVRSAMVSVTVVPRLSIAAAPSATKAGRSIAVRARLAPVRRGARATLSTCLDGSGRWVAGGSIRPSSTGLAVFHPRLAYGRTLLRVSVRADAAAGYAEATSRTIAVTASGSPPPGKHHGPKRACK